MDRKIFKKIFIGIIFLTAVLGAFFYFYKCDIFACGEEISYSSPSPSASQPALQTPQKFPQSETNYSKPGLDDTIKFPVFNYHHVGKLPEGADINRRAFTVSSELLEQHLMYFRDHGYKVVPVGDLIEYFETGKPLPKKAVAITFDDGYREHYENAFPLLKKYGVVGTFFIPTGWISQKAESMTWDQVKEMGDAGMIIGSHAISHPNLNNLSDADLKKELEESKKIIEEKTGRPCDFIAYPGGSHNERVIGAVKVAGYKAAMGVYKVIEQLPKYIYGVRRFHADDNMESVVGKLEEANY